MKTEKTEIEKATEALIAAFKAELERLPADDDSDAFTKDEKRLRKLCKKAIEAIELQDASIFKRRNARRDKKSPPPRPINFNFKVDLDEITRVRDEAMRRVEEAGARRKLARQIIDAGYKALATKMHPDIGGSHEAMTRLNQTRNQMKRDNQR